MSTPRRIAKASPSEPQPGRDERPIASIKIGKRTAAEDAVIAAPEVQAASDKASP